MITTGERQYGNLQEIRRDHMARYEFVTRQLHKTDIVIDAACGCGYGSFLMAANAGHVAGYDNSADAIEYAVNNYQRLNTDFFKKTLPCKLHISDVSVCFETLEHIDNAIGLLRELRSTSIKLFASVPNEEIIPFNPTRFPFHKRHYTKQQFDKLLNEAGWVVNRWYGQEGAYSEVEENINGRTLIAECA